MDFGLSPQTEEVCARMWGFMREEVFPAEKEYEQWRAKTTTRMRILRCWSG